MDDGDYMAMALAEAESAAARGEVPVGAVLAGSDGAVLARTGNRIVELKDPTAHAEILALREAGRVLGNERLVGCTLYVTLEPCAMCAGAISLARVARLVFAAEDPKGGAVLHGPLFYAQPTCHHRPVVTRAGDGEAVSQVLKNFFQARRNLRSNR